MKPIRRPAAALAAAAPLLLPLLLSAPAQAQLAARVFAGTWGPGGAGQGHVERYESGTTWTRITSQRRRQTQNSPCSLPHACIFGGQAREVRPSGVRQGTREHVGDHAAASDAPHAIGTLVIP